MRVWRALLPIWAVAAAAPATAPTSAHPAALAGRYDGGRMEVAAGLILRADGHFRYALSYGSLDEAAAGTWEARGGHVLLTTLPAVRPPRFVAVSDAPDIRGGLNVRLADPKAWRGAPLGLLLLYGPGEAPIEVEADADGHVAFPDSRRPQALLPLMPVYPPVGEPYALSGKSGHRITFRFEPRDLGKADFRGQPLRIEGDTLILARFGLELRFRRQ